MKNAGILAVLLTAISLVFAACSNPASPTVAPPTAQSPTQQAPTKETAPIPTPSPQPASTPTQSETPIPTPKFATPGTGAAIGQVMLPDGEPAHRCIVYIFKEEETESLASCYVDTNGYYMFDDLPPGRYLIYSASYASFWGFARDPEAIVTVSDHKISSVPTIKQIGHINIELDNPQISRLPDQPQTKRYVINGTYPKFTWSKIDNTSYYAVTIYSILDGAYNVTCNTTENRITWSDNLSTLNLEEFRIDVNSYVEGGILKATGMELFSVDKPLSGWVLD
jgi:hypothetical protein